MGALTRIFSPISSARRSLDSATPGALLRSLRGAGDGDITTPTSAMQVAAVYACVRVIATNIAALPLVLMHHDGQRRTTATDHPLYSILHWLPNPEMTSIQFRMSLGVHLALYGNAYAQIVRDRGGRIRELWPLRPDRITSERAADGALVYRYNSTDGQHLLSKAEVFHITHLSFDGQTGYSPITLARRTFDTKARMEEYSATFYQNDASPGVVLRHPATLTDQKYERIRAQWEDRHRGPNQAGRTAILEQGMDITRLSVAQADAQFLESQKFTRQEIAALFGVPAHMINDLDRATFSNIEEMAQEFVDYTLMPYLEGWQQAIHRDLLSESERAHYYAHFRTQALLRGAHASRAQFYQALQQVGALSPNDIRALEDMNPLPDGGDLYLAPLNMAPVDAFRSDQGATAPAARQSSLAAAWRTDIETRLRGRVANDIRQSGAKVQRSAGADGLTAWLTTQRAQWRAAGQRMMQPLAELAPADAGADLVLLDGWIDDEIAARIADLEKLSHD